MISEIAQDREDLLRLMDTLRNLAARDTAKAIVCGELLAKLSPHAETPSSQTLSSAASSSRQTRRAFHTRKFPGIASLGIKRWL